MVLFIDTSNYEKTRFGLVDDGAVIEDREIIIPYDESFRTLSYVKEMITGKKIDKIVVCSGPGAFTGTRVGVSIAEGLSMALSVPVVMLPKDKIPNDLVEIENLESGSETPVYS